MGASAIKTPSPVSQSGLHRRPTLSHNYPRQVCDSKVPSFHFLIVPPMPQRTPSLEPKEALTIVQRPWVLKKERDTRDCWDGFFQRRTRIVAACKQQSRPPRPTTRTTSRLPPLTQTLHRSKITPPPHSQKLSRPFVPGVPRPSYKASPCMPTCSSQFPRSRTGQPSFSPGAPQHSHTLSSNSRSNRTKSGVKPSQN